MKHIKERKYWYKNSYWRASKLYVTLHFMQITPAFQALPFWERIKIRLLHKRIRKYLKEQGTLCQLDYCKELINYRDVI